MFYLITCLAKVGQIVHVEGPAALRWCIALLRQGTELHDDLRPCPMHVQTFMT